MTEDCMRFLFLGDIVGRSGRQSVIENLPKLLDKYAFDFVVANGENAAGGFGINESICQELFDAGVDVITLGNHAFDQRDTLVFIERMEGLIRPINLPSGTPGRGAGLFLSKGGYRVLVINVLGRVFMEPQNDPFAAVEAEIAAAPLGEQSDAIIVDMHAEATSEKQSLGHFLDGRVSLVIGTHTHVPTADYQILPSGTAYMSDAGMCGDYDSVLGMDKDEPINRFLRKIPSSRFTPAKGEATLCGLAVKIHLASGLALAVQPLRLGGRLASAKLDGF